MKNRKLTERLRSNKTLISDGAWGTFLQKKGLLPGHCPELWCIEQPEDVFDVAKSYVDAGSDMIKTNSFGGTRYKLEHYQLENRVEEINEAAARISRSAAGEKGIVLGSMGSTGKMLIMEEISEDEMYEAYKIQAAALEKGGADAACIETMSDVDEACTAIKAVKDNTGLEIICTFTFERIVSGDYRTMMGVTPEDALQRVMEAGADIAGTNCGNGFLRMIDIIARMRAVDDRFPLLVHANAGLPQNIDGEDVFPDTPEDMAGLVPALLKAGANIIGGCCGTTPEHIKAIKKAIDLC